MPQVTFWALLPGHLDLDSLRCSWQGGRGMPAASIYGHTAAFVAATKATGGVLVPHLDDAQPSLWLAPGQINAPVLQPDRHCHSCVPQRVLHDVTAAARQMHCATAAGCWGSR